MSSPLSLADTTNGLGAVREVSDGVFAYVQPDGSWWINNTGFVVGSKGVAAIDACSTERRTRGLIDAIRSTTPAPVRTLVNTHHHGDHTYGNYLFDTATIVAQEQCRTEILEAGLPASAPTWTDVEWGNIELAPPFLTYEDKVNLYVDDLKCEVRYVGTPAHTTNDSVVWIPERSTLFCGDLLFEGGTPFLLMGSIAGAVEVLEGLKKLDAQTIVPGHGAVSGPALIDTILGYLAFVQSVARHGQSAGLTPLEAARETDLGEYAELLDAERIVGNLHRAYAELDGAERGARIDVPAAFADMVTYNGGQPLTCHA
ncbi:MAG: fold metallo-hydrolase [Marmoricola sp.]|jgi:cyclase|nr:fold metallo-hydrolase [Marmoricola sp.]